MCGHLFPSVALPALGTKIIRHLRRTAEGERRCFNCAQVFYPEKAKGLGRYFCPLCASLLPRREKGFCPLCGELYQWEHLPPAPCARCLREPPPWQRLIFYGAHENLLRKLLLDLKFREHIHLAVALGKLLTMHPDFPKVRADLVAPMPLHPRRLRQRGYNQALELARPLAAALNLPLLPDLLARGRETEPQTRLARSVREKNLKGVFVCVQRVRGLHILLVDDTMTTGATMREAAQTLLFAEAASVSAALVSRTPLS
ncbi:MAG: ComF family protein [Desulfovibrio sp.]|jgi:ComF family protein|nr:ComF family protein [Desulfovibrio sp.]